VILRPSCPTNQTTWKSSLTGSRGRLLGPTPAVISLPSLAREKPRLGAAADPSEILELFWDGQLPNTVLCTHGETIGRLFARLAGHGLVAPAPLVWPKGSAWLLHRTDQRQVHARYLSPLALDRQLPTVHPFGVMLMRGPRHRVDR
jgi:hypothetical protein